MNGYGNVIKSNMVVPSGMPLRINFDNRDRFVDITNENLHIPYHDTEVLLGHTFKHITKGIFKATPGFYADKQLMSRLHAEYPDVRFCFAVTDEIKDSRTEEGRVVFAYWYSTDDNYGGDKGFILNEYIENRIDPRFFADEEKLLGFTDDSFDVGERTKTRALRPYDDGTVINGEKAFINVYGYIGMLVEPGIYSFIAESDIWFRGVEMRGVPSNVGRPVAWVGFTYLDSWVDVACYMAIDPKYFGRLKEIADSMDRLRYYEEPFLKRDSSAVSQCDPITPRTMTASETEEVKAGIIASFSVEDGAVELVQGMGFHNIELWFSRPFFDVVHEKKYDIAYRKNDELVLITIEPFPKKIYEERHKLAMMDHLYVKEKKTLRNGDTREFYHSVIHDEEKIRQLLSPAGYDLYMAEHAVKRKQL